MLCHMVQLCALLSHLWYYPQRMSFFIRTLFSRTAVHRRWKEVPEKLPDLLAKKPNWILRFIIKRTAGSVQQDLYSQGMGRHTTAEVAHIAVKDLRSLSTILGDRPYLLGDKPSSYDAAVFSALAVYLWQLPGSAHETYLNTEGQNLVRYCERLREKWYSDWDELTAR